MRYGGHGVYGSYSGVAIDNDGNLSITNSAITNNGAFTNQPVYAIYSSAGTLSISNSTIADNYMHGVYQSGGTLSISSSTIANNGGHGMFRVGGSTVIRDSSILGHGSYGVFDASTSIPLNAEGNYWGSPSGPAPYGNGNGVNYTEWWDSTLQQQVRYYYVDAEPWAVQEFPWSWQQVHQVSRSTPSSSATAWVAEPVNAITGHYSFQRTDLSVPGLAGGLSFARSYLSASPAEGPLGRGWTHGYRLSVPEESSAGTSSATVRREDGRLDRYTRNADGSYSPPPGTYDTLVKNAGGTFTLTTKERTLHSFDTSGRLLSIPDRNGNATTLSYTGTLLSRVAEPSGRYLAFTHDG